MDKFLAQGNNSLW